MGSCHRLGSVSRLPIVGGDKVVGILGIQSLNDNGSLLFLPLNYPIYGVYDGMGSMVNIDPKSSHISDTLCHLFKCNDIEKIIKAASTSEGGMNGVTMEGIDLSWLEDYTINLKGPDMWCLELFMEHASFYDRMSDIPLHDERCPFRVKLTHELLVDYLGFKEDSNTPGLYKKDSLTVKCVDDKVEGNRYYIVSEERDPYEVYHVRDLMFKVSDLYGYSLKVPNPMSHTRWKYTLFLKELNRVLNNNTDVFDLGRFEGFVNRLFDSYPVEGSDLSDDEEFLEKNNWFEDLCDLFNDLFEFEYGLPLVENMVRQECISLYDAYFNTSTDDMHNIDYTVYADDYIRYKEFSRVLYEMGLYLDPSPCAKGIFPITAYKYMVSIINESH